MLQIIEMNDNLTSENKYEQTLTIPCYATDASFHLKPAAFMDYMQEIAYLAATRLHFGYDELQEIHTAWVLSRMHFKFDNPPQWRDTVKLRTWHKGLDGLMFLRDFRMLDMDGKELLTATTSWLVINTKTRRLVRSDEILDIVPASTQCSDNAIVESAPKVVVPKSLEKEKVAEHVVTYSDVDIIGHTNNARYMVWAMDCLDYAVTSRQQVKEVWINFNKETKPGETVEIFKAMAEEDDSTNCYIEGMAEGKSAFCIKLRFQE